MKTLAKLTVLIFSSLLLFTGCSTSGMFASINTTNVELRQANYKIIAKNINGEAEAGYLFGFTMPAGSATNVLALIRVSGTGLLYKEALESLWKNYEEKYGAVEGEKLALVNVRYDTDASNFILYTGAKVHVRADVVRFE